MIVKPVCKVLMSSVGVALVTVALSGCGSNTSSGTSPSNETAPPSVPTTVSPASGVSPGKDAAGSFKEAGALWKQIGTASAALDAVIKSNKLDSVHEAAFKVRDLVNQLPGKSSSLSADKQKTLAEQVKNVAQLADLLDKAGDSNNLKSVQANRDGLNDALEIIKGLYPKDSLR